MKYIVKDVSKGGLGIAGTESWGEIWEVIKTPDTVDSVKAETVGFLVDKESAEAIKNYLTRSVK